VCIPTIFYCFSDQYDLAFSSKLVHSTTSENCQEVELHWNPLPNSDVLYIISVLSIEDEDNLTTEWNTTTQKNSVILPQDKLAVGTTYEAELQVVHVIAVVDGNSSLPMGAITTQLLNVTLPACSKPKRPKS